MSDSVARPRLALAVAVVAISTSAILVRWSTAPPVVAAFYRVLLTTALLAPLLLARHADALGDLSGRHLLAAGLTGVALAAHFATWFESLSWTSVAASVTLVQSQPIFVVTGAWLLLNERVTGRTVLGVVVAIGGIVVMSLGDLLGGTAVGPRPLYGNALALVGGLMAASYVLAGRSLRQRLPLLPYVTVVYGVAALALLAVVLAQGHPLTGYESREWLLFLGMAVGPGILGHTLVNWSLAHVESSLVSVTLLGEPLGSALLALLLLTEVPSSWTVAGGAVVLAGITLTARSSE
ncbi:DMT family transporter [Halomicrobium sp. LC1Hm]|uniref:DMT family transporter n=1 Tax=Halomicrobium sp. LC1Hm TaxID=2610902 RepID=UPI0012982B59|nr:DMT family transporter [Halomicrobium sp. LC1Hm]QGA83483.1 Permease of the drug/metabolite transporter (DMT) superfamily [Halomicrobium sp. LC1Hm]